MAAIVQWLERLIVVQDVVGSNPTSRPIKPSSFLHKILCPHSRFPCIIFFTFGLFTALRPLI